MTDHHPTGHFPIYQQGELAVPRSLLLEVALSWISSKNWDSRLHKCISNSFVHVYAPPACSVLQHSKDLWGKTHVVNRSSRRNWSFLQQQLLYLLTQEKENDFCQQWAALLSPTQHILTHQEPNKSLQCSCTLLRMYTSINITDRCHLEL